MTDLKDDMFSKRFVYYLAFLMVCLVMGFDYCMFFVHYPAENRDMINSVAGVLNTGGLIMILSFFYGSSKSSEDKSKVISDMVK